jgi:hypothetical protein
MTSPNGKNKMPEAIQIVTSMGKVVLRKDN